MTRLHDALKDSGSLLYVATAGCGPSLIHELWRAAGSSTYLVGARLLSSRVDTHDFIGRVPDSYVSEESAYELAMASYIRCVEHAVANHDKPSMIYGVGIEGCVASNYVPKGGYRAHIVLITPHSVTCVNLMLRKEETRARHDDAIRGYVIDMLVQAAENHVPLEDNGTGPALDVLHAHPVFHTDGTRSKATPVGLYLPATLNPLHDGHRKMCERAEHEMSMRASYLVSSSSAHKGAMSLQQILTIAGTVRAERWRPEHTPRSVEFTRNEPLFIDKARNRPGSTFIIGADAMARMLDPKWGHDVPSMLEEMRNLDVEFLVMGREIDGKWTECRDIPVPWPNQMLFRPLPGRMDISSTQLREAT